MVVVHKDNHFESVCNKIEVLCKAWDSWASAHDWEKIRPERCPKCGSDQVIIKKESLLHTTDRTANEVTYYKVYCDTCGYRPIWTSDDSTRIGSYNIGPKDKYAVQVVKNWNNDPLRKSS